jgi:hypothetical protein
MTTPRTRAALAVVAGLVALGVAGPIVVAVLLAANR